MITLYDYLPSQNAYKVRLLLKQLGRAYRTEYVSIFEGEGRDPAFLRISPTGAVPAIALEDGRALAESNAILTFLAEGTRFSSDDPFERAKIVQWLCFEADYVQSTVATLRHWVMTGKDKNRPAALLEGKRAGSLRTLGVLDRELAERDFLVGRYTIADIANFAYVHRADEAGLPLADFRNIARWIEAVRAQPDFLSEVHPYAIDPHSAKELPG